MMLAPRWFLLVNGVALLLMGITLLVGRLRERPLVPQLLGILWALLCCTVGVGLLLMAQGHVNQPGAHTPKQPAQGLHRPGALEFPSGQ
jgi:hypothetical protein